MARQGYYPNKQRQSGKKGDFEVYLLEKLANVERKIKTSVGATSRTVTHVTQRLDDVLCQQ